MAIAIQLPERQQTPLTTLATQTGRSASDLVVEAVDRMLAYEQWFDAQVQIGIDQIARGEFLEADEMDKRFQSMRKR